MLAACHAVEHQQTKCENVDTTALPDLPSSPQNELLRSLPACASAYTNAIGGWRQFCEWTMNKLLSKGSQ